MSNPRAGRKDRVCVYDYRRLRRGNIFKPALLAAYIVFVSSLSAYTTYFERYGGELDDRGYCVHAVEDGYIIVGETESYGAGQLDLWLLKVDTLGNVMWSKTYGGGYSDCGYSFDITDDGGLIIVGRTSSFGAGFDDIYLLRTNANGETLWTKTIGGNDYDQGWAVVETEDGGFVIAGRTKSFGAGYFDVYLVKTDSLGDTIWTYTYGGVYNDEVYSLIETSDGCFTMAGRTSSFGQGASSVLLVKTASNGMPLWARTYGGTNWDEARDVCETSDGGYIIVGKTISFGDNFDIYVIRTDSMGDTIWTRTYGGSDEDEAWSVCRTTDGGYVITGGTCSFGNGDWQIILLKIDSLGEVIWTRLYGNAYTDIGSYIETVDDGGFIVTGKTTPPSGADDDIVLIKTDPDGYVDVFEGTGCGLNRPSELEVYPNPFIGQCMVNISDLKLQIYDMSGRLVSVAKGNLIGGNLPPGIYILKTDGMKPLTIVKLSN